ncbi:hypothetical protein SRHO_G00256660 [Serrasalmus rhombeus]
MRGHRYSTCMGFSTDCCTCSCDCGIGCGAYAAEEGKSAAPDVIWPVITQRSMTRMEGSSSTNHSVPDLFSSFFISTTTISQ